METLEMTKPEEQQKSGQVTPEQIMKIGIGFWPAKVLMTAVKFGLFTFLAKKPGTASEIRSKLGLKCTDRHLYDFLDVLSGLGFLKREGLLENAVYSNAPDAAEFLDENKPSYIGGILQMANNRLYRFWGDLDQGLLTGQPQNEIKEGDEDIFAALYSDKDRLREFMNAMSGIQMGNFMTFAKTFDFTGHKTLLDAGGASALLSAMVVKHQPHMNCISLDLPAVEPIARENIERMGVPGRVQLVSSDLFKDPLPKADLVVMGNILHDWDEEKKLLLMQKAYDALPEGGAFVAIENVIDADRKENVFGMMSSLNMLIETGTGFDYTTADFNGWAEKIGFKRTSFMPLTGPTSAAIAYK